VRAALTEGWTHQRISEATGLTRGRINQLANPSPDDDDPFQIKKAAEQAERYRQARIAGKTAPRRWFD
jgi:hypothetical protein